MAMIELQAPAKVNLDLYIRSRRDDGYHEVSTRMQKLDLADLITLELTDRPGIILGCDDPGLPGGRDNLAVAAAEAFLGAANLTQQGVAIRLRKRIPVAAGLGGGSSDAGTVLRGLNRLCGDPFSEAHLVDLARPLGADVPFFASASNAVIATGIGDRLLAVPPLEGYWFLLVNPGVGVSTRWVFENFALTTKAKNSTVTGFRNTDSCDFSPAEMHNDLEQVTASRYPVVNEIKQLLLDSGAAAAMMSGSGSTVFGLFADDNGTETDRNQLIERFSSVYGERVYAARTYGGA